MISQENESIDQSINWSSVVKGEKNWLISLDEHVSDISSRLSGAACTQFVIDKGVLCISFGSGEISLILLHPNLNWFPGLLL